MWLFRAGLFAFVTISQSTRDERTGVVGVHSIEPIAWSTVTRTSSGTLALGGVPPNWLGSCSGLEHAAALQTTAPSALYSKSKKELAPFLGEEVSSALWFFLSLPAPPPPPSLPGT